MQRHFGIISASLLVVSRSLDSLFKVLFNFRSRYLFAIGLAVIFSLRRCIPPTSSCTLKQPYSQANAFVLAHTGLAILIRDFNPLWSAICCSFEYMPVYTLNSSNQLTRSIVHLKRFQMNLCVGLYPLRSPLLGVSLLFSLPPLIDMFKFSGYSHLTEIRVWK
jgi:hypothetical protein